MNERKIDRITQTPPVGPGFAGPAHTATSVVNPGNFAKTNPFFLMMDDRVSLTGPFGEAHPHAGLETVTLMLEGRMRDEGGELRTDDVEWMSAGSGIVHSEHSQVDGPMRLLQLWVVLPDADRTMSPRVQLLRKQSMPVLRAPGVEARLYSGTMGDLTAPTLNAVPILLVDVVLAADAQFQVPLPASYNGFLVVEEGEVLAGSNGDRLSKGLVGWTSPVETGTSSMLTLRTEGKAARVLFYAGEPQKLSIASRGPFISGSDEELDQLFARYRAGRFPRAGTLRASQP
jgi:quercetin 2,3-dioxygenase